MFLLRLGIRNLDENLETAPSITSSIIYFHEVILIGFKCDSFGLSFILNIIGVLQNFIHRPLDK